MGFGKGDKVASTAVRRGDPDGVSVGMSEEMFPAVAAPEEFYAEGTLGGELAAIRAAGGTNAERGARFESLVRDALLLVPELRSTYEIAAVWRWADWPERSEVAGSGGGDVGADLVARRTDGTWVAIQCKFYAADASITLPTLQRFHSIAAQEWCAMGLFVATCGWNSSAEKYLLDISEEVRRLDFAEYAHLPLPVPDAAPRPPRKYRALQEPAVDAVVDGLTVHDRGRFIMACGTGKTFLSLRAAERLYPDGGTLLFLAPSIALVAQARREYLLHADRWRGRLSCIVVCSDRTSGRTAGDEAALSELECPVTTDPAAIAAHLAGEGQGNETTRAVFCTYQSIDKVISAQNDHAAAPFDLTVADEAHRTTGIAERSRNAGFRAVHHDLASVKRLYMTATPRVYTTTSRRRQEERGFTVVDMSNEKVYGPQLHSVSFRAAVEEGILSDYRVIVLAAHQGGMLDDLRGTLVDLDPRTTITGTQAVALFGVALAINGAAESAGGERTSPVLPRILGFWNTVKRSRWAAEALGHEALRDAIADRLPDGEEPVALRARHLDAGHGALARNIALRELNAADDDSPLLISNVGLFSEGVDVPGLSAVAFFEPRDSQVDVVQAVGRVMRKADGKRLGYIIVPVVVSDGQTVEDALTAGSAGYKTLARVLAALRSHDTRLAEDPLRFVSVAEVGNGSDHDEAAPEGDVLQPTLDLEEATEGIVARIVAGSGLRAPGAETADDIADAVRAAARTLTGHTDTARLAAALALPPSAKPAETCTVAALLLANACLLHRRLHPHIDDLPLLDRIATTADPAGFLTAAWRHILRRDYKPVFAPAVAALGALNADDPATGAALRRLAECAGRVADTLSDMGYDHAGPLYHRILGTAANDGAYYTHNLAGLMLARIAMGPGFADWAGTDAVAALRVIDPACGTGTLLMAALRTVKDRVAEAAGAPLDDETAAALHKTLVESTLHGLDINPHATQLAACNLTLGAPAVDYGRMRLHTMPYGPHSDGAVRNGSLELLTLPARGGGRLSDLLGQLDLFAPTPARLTDLDAAHITDADNSDADYDPIDFADLVIMNPPFTANIKRGKRFPNATLAAMRRRELAIRDRAVGADPDLDGVTDQNSIGTYFTPIAERLVAPDGTVAKIIPVTACTTASGRGEREFLAARYVIERVVAFHDPKRISLSENTSINECMLVARRRTAGDDSDRPTRFVAVSRYPRDPGEAVAIADAVLTDAPTVGDTALRSHDWPAHRIATGDWTPVQWWDAALAEAAHDLAEQPALAALGELAAVGPAGQRIRDAFDRHTVGDYRVLWDHETAQRTTIAAKADTTPAAKPPKRAYADERLWPKAGHLLISNKLRTNLTRTSAVWLDQRGLGSAFSPIHASVENDHDPLDVERAWAVWLNSTPAVLTLLNMRSKSLSYADYSLDSLRSLPVPDPDRCDLAPLIAAFHTHARSELAPWRTLNTCPTRAALDTAAAAATGLDLEQVVDWRHRIAGEPFVTNQRHQP